MTTDDHPRGAESEWGRRAVSDNKDRTRRWWSTVLAAYYVVLAGVFDDPARRWTVIVLAMLFTFVAGWQWREWTAHKRVMRLAETDAWQTAIRNETRDI